MQNLRSRMVEGIWTFRTGVLVIQLVGLSRKGEVEKAFE